ncbi:PREDICTED: putative E3 ubiquitin-protein ligase UNKL, partial [Pterocles gutturalis]|uniref:putative E3 ubiquitin-protein ligase UNKL n=1 Tax=Pterocles gutturalis TaxID=240206 RepID=UPI0005285C90
QRFLGSSAPVNIPGSLVHSSSLHSSSSLSTSPLSSLSQSLSQSFVSSTTAPHHQLPQPLKTEHSMLGTSASSHNSLGLNGVTGSIWDFVTGSFSPSPSPVLSSGTAPSISSNTSENELTRVRQELGDAKRRLKQWEESWQQVKQACDAWQKEAQEAKERANIADADKQLALQKKEEVENKFKKLKAQLAACLSTTLPYTKNGGDTENISLPKLCSLQNQLHLDLETLDEVIFQLQSKRCVVCQEGDRSIILNPCQHYVLCDHSAAAQEECPCCKKKNICVMNLENDDTLACSNISTENFAGVPCKFLWGSRLRLACPVPVATDPAARERSFLLLDARNRTVGLVRPPGGQGAVLQRPVSQAADP